MEIRWSHSLAKSAPPLSRLQPGIAPSIAAIADCPIISVNTCIMAACTSLSAPVALQSSWSFSVNDTTLSAAFTALPASRLAPEATVFTPRETAAIPLPSVVPICSDRVGLPRGFDCPPPVDI